MELLYKSKENEGYARWSTKTSVGGIDYIHGLWLQYSTYTRRGILKAPDRKRKAGWKLSLISVAMYPKQSPSKDTVYSAAVIFPRPTGLG